MKRILIKVMLLTLPVMVQAQAKFETAHEAVGNMQLGWNLGNTLDSNSGDVNNMWIEAWTNRKPADYETAWGQPVTKPELMKMFKEAGFNAIRVPVTWYPHMEATFKSVKWDNAKQALTTWDMANDLGTKVDAEWMKRVREVVDYVIGQGMYCILNVHHDTGASNTAWLIADDGVYKKERSRFEALWTQIAEEFRDYDEHLLFEGYNEMLDTQRSWCFASFAANGGYNASIAKSAYSGINSYAQSFVDAVRATGGNNAQRNLIVNTYGSCSGSGTWSSHLQDPLKQMKLPEDAAKDHLLFEIHSYLDVKNLNNAKKEVDQMISDVKTNLMAKGAPVIFGEWGTSTENGYENYRSNMLAFARYFVQQATINGIGTFYWMGLSDGNHRSVPEFNQKDLVEALRTGYYAKGGGETAVTSQESTLQAHSDIYDLKGRKTGPNAAPRKGLYVVRSGGKGRKVLAK